MYKCAKCEKPVTIDKNGKITRSCDHVDAAILAKCSAVLVGKSVLK